MRIIITESQYKKILIREFGETVKDPKKWYNKILKWVDGDRSRLNFDSKSYETIAYDDKGIYLGYYDKESGYGFVVTEYGIGMDDYSDEEIIDEDEAASAPAGGATTFWPFKDLNRGVSNNIDGSPWPDSVNRGPGNQLN